MWQLNNVYLHSQMTKSKITIDKILLLVTFFRKSYKIGIVGLKLWL